ncbi:NUDIX domain-containing protein [Candidatus Pacearchaeota archaeon]|nr:NUDIX domain-containing protein [Candidatus Pacearchaeota archaeon]
MDVAKAHYIVVTGILVKDGKYLIVKRAPWEKAFPGKWTVPGGKLETKDYSSLPKDTSDHWYNVLENVLRREMKEEVGISIDKIGYVCSMVYIRPDGIPCLIVSLYAHPDSHHVTLCKDLTEYAWVTLEEAKKYDFMEGMYDELVMLESFLKTGQHMVWRGN